MKKTILTSISNATEEINFKSKIYKSKSNKLISYIFNMYIISKKSFNEYVPLSKQYFMDVCETKKMNDIYDFILNPLLENKILEKDNHYNTKKGIGMGYRFNQNLIKEDKIDFDIIDFNTKDTVNFDEYTINLLKEVKIENTEDLEIVINNIIEDKMNNILVDNDITDEYIYLKFSNKENKTYRYSLNKAIEYAKSLDLNLIKWNDKFYIDNLDIFIQSKKILLKTEYKLSLFNLDNNILYASRNETNNRLDSNLTALKSELWKYLKLDNEELVEIDIVNSQFAIASFINETDKDFIKYSQEGTLYDYIAEKLNITRKEAKSLMFRVSFDKVRSENEFEKIRKLFPIFMNWVDTFKKEKGYKLFSNLLQKTESKIMIDGLLAFLIKKGYKVFTVHDSVRVKKSQYEEIQLLVKEYFESINFKCSIKNKSLSSKKENTKLFYEEGIKETFYNIYTSKPFKSKKEEILNKLYESQTKSKNKIIEIIKSTLKN